MRERIGKVRREHGDARTFGRAGTAVEDAMARGRDGALSLRKRPPPRAEINALQRHSAPEKERRQVGPQMVALQPRVVRQNFARRQAIGGTAQRAGFTGEHAPARVQCGSASVRARSSGQFSGVAMKWRRSGTSERTSSAMRRQSSGSPVQKVTTTASGSLPSSRKIQRFNLCFIAVR